MYVGMDFVRLPTVAAEYRCLAVEGVCCWTYFFYPFALPVLCASKPKNEVKSGKANYSKQNTGDAEQTGVNFEEAGLEIAMNLGCESL